MALNYTLKQTEEKKIVDGGFLIYDSLFLNVLGITSEYKTLESIQDFIKLINSADFTYIDSRVVDADYFLKEINNFNSSSFTSNIRKIDFYFNYILDALHYNYTIHLINATNENNVYFTINEKNLDYLVYDPLKTSISANFINEIKLKAIPILFNASLRENSFLPLENSYIVSNVTDISTQFDNFYLRPELTDSDFNQLSFTIGGVKRSKRYYSDDNISDDSEYSNSPYVLIPLLSDIAGMMARSYSLYPWISIAGIQNGKILNQKFSKINLPNINYSEDIIPSTPTNITFSSNSKLNVAQTRAINSVLKLSSIGIKEYFLATNLSGITSTSNDIKKTFSYSTLYADIVKKSKSTITEYLFEQNTPEIRAEIKQKFDLFLEEIKTNNGIESFLVICDETNNTNESISTNKLVIDINFKPVQSKAVISLNFTT
jgi:hypothetical protein